MPKLSQEELFKLFKNQYAKKYSFDSDEPIDDGVGGYGIIYKAYDIDRQIEVAIKLFHDGITPDGTGRSWKLTSKMMHHQVASTHTIERFSDGDLEYRAAVTRFIPGKSLSRIFKDSEKENKKMQALLARDLCQSLIPSILEALEVCHRLGYGHGDLHEGNVMIIPTNYGAKNTFTAVLIDFDNESILAGHQVSTEKEKIEKDIRLLSRLLTNISLEWQWFEEFKSIYTDYKTAGDIMYAWNQALDLIRRIKVGQCEQQDFYEHLKPLTVGGLGGFQSFYY